MQSANSLSNDDYGSSYINAYPLPLNPGIDGLSYGAIKGFIGPEDPTDEDWFKISLIEGSNYEFTLTGGTDSNELKGGTLSWYDKDGQRELSWWYWDTQLSSYDGKIVTQPISLSGEYYLRVDLNASADATGKYTLEVEQLTPGNALPTPTTPPSFDSDSTSNPVVDEKNNPSKIDIKPKLLSATLRVNKIFLRFNDEISDTLPPLDKFTLYHDKKIIELDNITAEPLKGLAILTTQNNIGSKANLSLDYFDNSLDQENGVIQSKSGIDLNTFTNFTVKNKTPKKNTLSIQDGNFDSSSINLKLNDAFGSSIPSLRLFKIKSGRHNVRIIDVNTDPLDGMIYLTPKKNLGRHRTLSISYNKPKIDHIDGIIENKNGNDMKSFRNFKITNSNYSNDSLNIDDAQIVDNIITINFDFIIGEKKISKKLFNVRVNSKRLRVKSASIQRNDKSKVELILNPNQAKTIDTQSKIHLTYNDPKGDQNKHIIEDTFGNDLTSFKNYNVDIA